VLLPTAVTEGGKIKSANTSQDCLLEQNLKCGLKEEERFSHCALRKTLSNDNGRQTSLYCKECEQRPPYPNQNVQLTTPDVAEVSRISLGF
jgi:hypothetical protein